MLGKYATARFGVIMGIVISFCLVVAIVCVVCLQPVSFKPNTSLNNSGDDFIDNAQTYVEPSVAASTQTVTNGSYTYEQKTEASTTFYELTASPSAGYNFAYWTKSGVKISGDRTIRIYSSSYSAGTYVPVFISESNTTYITSLSSISLAADGNAGKLYILTQDITLTSNHTPIGNGSTTAFAGVIDGNGHKIQGLNATRTSGDYYGGIVCRLTGVIKNLTIFSGVINGNTAANIGAFAGTVETGGLLSRCINRAEVKGDLSTNTPNVGGIVGAAVGSTALSSAIYCCENYGSVTGNKVGAILYSNPTVNSSPICYLINNKYAGSLQTN